MDDYAPRSPDLSALGSFNSREPLDKQSDPSSYNNYQRDSFPGLPQSSYYQPPASLPNQTPPAFSHPSYPPPSLQEGQIQHFEPSYSQSPSHAHHGTYIKSEHEWLAQQSSLPRASGTSASGKLGRKMSSKLPPPEPEPRPPAPGDAEGIIVKTKFPVARIKRIVQADEEVGKVAQATPVAVGKALELFMIQMTLSAINEASGRGSKRLAASHIKAAINRDDKFDFLKDIGDKIPDDPGTGRRRGGGEGRPKIENASEEDVDMDSEGKSKRKPRAGKKRKVARDDD